MNKPTLDQALSIARQLAPRDRALLVARIVEEMAEPVTEAATAVTTDAWTHLWQAADEIGAAPQRKNQAISDQWQPQAFGYARRVALAPAASLR